MYVEHRLRGAAAASEVPTGASVAAAGNRSSTSRDGTVVPAHCQFSTVTAAARRTSAFPAAFPAEETAAQ